MFIVLLTYKKSLELVDKYLAEHRDFLGNGYQQNFFIASGPRNPRTGGVLLSQLTDKSKLEEILKQDPFYIQDIADYEIIEFTPVKFHGKFSEFIKTQE